MEATYYYGGIFPVNKTLFLSKLLPSFTPGKMVDLAAGHLKHTEMALALGWKVTAVDRTARRVPENLKQHFVLGDAVKFSLDEFDLVLCCGLLYHLNKNHQEDLLHKIAERPFIVETIYVEGKYNEPRPPTRSSEAFCVIPSLTNILKVLSPCAVYLDYSPGRAFFWRRTKNLSENH